MYEVWPVGEHLCLSVLIKSGICKSHKILRIRGDYKPFSSFLTPQDVFLVCVLGSQYEK